MTIHDNRPTAVNLTIWRVAAWCGPAFIVGLLVFWGLVAGYVPAPPQNWSPAEITAYYTDHNVGVKVGMVGTLFFAPFYFVWTTVVSRLIQRMEGPHGILSNVELIGGALTTVVAQLFAACWLAGAFHIADRSPQDVQLMHDLGWMFFNMTFFVTVFQMVGFGTAILVDPRKRSLFPRWLGWFSFAAAATFLSVLLMPFVVTGPFAWNGLMTYWLALTGYFSWAVIAMYCVFGAIRKIEQEDRPAAADMADDGAPAVAPADALSASASAG